MSRRTARCVTSLAACALLVACTSSSEGDAAAHSTDSTTTLAASETTSTGIYDIVLSTLEGAPTSLDAYRGRALLLVNVASKCGLTPQYAQLEQLQRDYADRGLTVVGFPCNQFRGQEPGTPDEIREFCSTTYGVSFPLMEKLDVNGDGRHPLYRLLTAVPDASGDAGDVQWNFEKFVISADGKTITRFRPRTTPDDPAVIAAIEAGLPKS
ncbi:MAG: glutathione peroxidase [Planctomycetes bacterium]|nr:glutathione peroxidase [Planctomycetota bacterium]